MQYDAGNPIICFLPLWRRTNLHIQSESKKLNQYFEILESTYGIRNPNENELK